MLAAVLATQWVLVADNAMITIALPTIQRAFTFTSFGTSWVINAYALAFGSLITLGGYASDRYGARRCLSLAMGMFACAALVVACANTAALLLGARMLQGCAAAFAAPSSLALIGPVNAASKHGAVAAIGVVSSAAFTLGAGLGAALTTLGWRFIPILEIVCAISVLSVLPRCESPRGRNSSRPARQWDVLLLTLALVALFYLLTAVVADDSRGMEAASGVLLSTGITLAHKYAPRRLTKHHLTNGIYWGSTCLPVLWASASSAAIVFTLTLYLQRSLHYSPARAGIYIALLGLPSVLGGASARFVSRQHHACLLTGALVLEALGIGLLAYVLARGDTLAMGFALGATGTGAMICIVTGMVTLVGSEVVSGRRAALFTSLLEIGAALGVGLVAIMLRAPSSYSRAGVPPVFYLLSFITFVCAIVAYWAPSPARHT